MDQGAIVIVIFAAVVLAGVAVHLLLRTRKKGPPPEA